MYEWSSILLSRFALAKRGKGTTPQEKMWGRGAERERERKRERERERESERERERERERV